MVVFNYNNNEIVGQPIHIQLPIEKQGELIRLEFTDSSSRVKEVLTLNDTSIYPQRFSRFYLPKDFLESLGNGEGEINFYLGTDLLATKRYKNNKQVATVKSRKSTITVKEHGSK